MPVSVPGRTIRLNVAMDEGLVSQIDRVAKNRSAFLADATRVALRSRAARRAGRPEDRDAQTVCVCEAPTGCGRRRHVCLCGRSMPRRAPRALLLRQDKRGAMSTDASGRRPASRPRMTVRPRSGKQTGRFLEAGAKTLLAQETIEEAQLRALVESGGGESCARDAA